MWKDEIQEEIHRIREEYAKSFDYDLQAICHDLRKKQAVKQLGAIKCKMNELR